MSILRTCEDSLPFLYICEKLVAYPFFTSEKNRTSSSHIKNIKCEILAQILQPKN